MNNIIKLVIVALLISTSSCKCQEKAATTAAANKKEANMKQVDLSGATMIEGTVIESGDKACFWAIELPDKSLVDPINLEDSYKKNGTKIHLTFGRLRMKNRCDKANPINITSIKLRGVHK